MTLLKPMSFHLITSLAETAGLPYWVSYHSCDMRRRYMCAVILMKMLPILRVRNDAFNMTVRPVKDAFNFTSIVPVHVVELNTRGRPSPERFLVFVTSKVARERITQVRSLFEQLIVASSSYHGIHSKHC